MGRWAQARRRGGAKAGRTYPVMGLIGSAVVGEFFLEATVDPACDSWQYEVEYDSAGWQPLASGEKMGDSLAFSQVFEPGAWTDMRGRARGSLAGAWGPWCEWVLWSITV